MVKEQLPALVGRIHPKPVYCHCFTALTSFRLEATEHGSRKECRTFRTFNPGFRFQVLNPSRLLDIQELWRQSLTKFELAGLFSSIFSPLFFPQASPCNHQGFRG